MICALMLIVGNIVAEKGHNIQMPQRLHIQKTTTDDETMETQIYGG